MADEITGLANKIAGMSNVVDDITVGAMEFDDSFADGLSDTLTRNKMYGGLKPDEFRAQKGTAIMKLPASHPAMEKTRR